MSSKKTYYYLAGIHPEAKLDLILQTLKEVGQHDPSEAGKIVGEVQGGERALLTLPGGVDTWDFGELMAAHGCVIECDGITHDHFGPERPEQLRVLGIVKLRPRALNYFEATVLKGILPDAFQVAPSPKGWGGGFTAGFVVGEAENAVQIVRLFFENSSNPEWWMQDPATSLYVIGPCRDQDELRPRMHENDGTEPDRNALGILEPIEFFCESEEATIPLGLTLEGLNELDHIAFQETRPTEICEATVNISITRPCEDMRPREDCFKCALTLIGADQQTFHAESFLSGSRFFDLMVSKKGVFFWELPHMRRREIAANSVLGPVDFGMLDTRERKEFSVGNSRITISTKYFGTKVHLIQSPEELLASL